MNLQRSVFLITTLASTGMCLILLSGCGASPDTASAKTSSSAVSAPPVAMHANVTGLTAGTPLTLSSTAGEELRISGSGRYAFSVPVATTAGAEPRILFDSHPEGHTCSQANGSGRVFGTNNHDTNIVCSDKDHSYTIGGRVHDLAQHHHRHHHDLVISDNGGPPLELDHDGEFRFPGRVARNASYRVVVDKQSEGEVCSISNGSGSGVTRNVTNIEIRCSEETLTLGGAISGLPAGDAVSITDGSNLTPLILTANGNYTFPVGVAYRGSYNVTVATQPASGICTVQNGQGHDVKFNVTNVNVICTADHYTVSGSVTGLAAGEQVTLKNNGANDLTVAANQNFTFSIPVAAHSSYHVTIGTQPFPESCVVTNGTGSNVTAGVSNVQVNCAAGAYSVLASFGAGSNSPGITVGGNLVQAQDGNFYGLSITGGTYGSGAIYQVTATGNVNVIYSLASGYQPYFSGLIQGNDGYLYGTTEYGGPGNCGTVFRVSTSGAFTALHQFTGSSGDGCNPQSGLLLASDGKLYGTTSNGGTYSNGTVFKVATDGSTENLVYSFGATPSDGVNPMYSSLIQAGDGNLYGVTPSGGTSGIGTVFKLTLVGVETILHNFGDFLPGDGFLPWSGLTVGPDGKLYGTTFNGGIFFGTMGQGTVFSLNTDGTNYTLIHEFASGANDGAQPLGTSLLLGPDGNFYSTTSTGGIANGGVLYRITTGGAVTVMYEFQGGANDGIFPESGVTLGTDGHLYGVTSQGGANSNGVVYRF